MSNPLTPPSPSAALTREGAAPAKALLFLLCAFGAGVYFNSLWGQLVFDDEWLMSNVEHRPAFWPLRQSWMNGRRPVVELSWNLNHAIFGHNIAAYHAVNVAIHVVAMIALFLLARLLLSSAFVAEELRKRAAGLAFVITLIWGVHPLNTQAVTYIVQRYESFASMLVFATLLFVAKGAVLQDGAASNPGGAGSSARPWFACAIAAAACAVLSKEIAVGVGVLALLMDRAFIAGSFGAAFRRRWGLYLTLFLLPLLYLITDRGFSEAVTTDASQAAAAGVHGTPFTPLQYLFAQGGAILHYLRLAIWPSPLCFDYFDWLPAKRLSDDLPAASVIGVLVLAAFWAVWKRPAIGFLAAFFFVVLAPSSSFLPVRDVVAEHRMYAPLAAVVALLVIGGWLLITKLTADNIEARRGSTAAVLGACALIVVVFSALTVMRNTDYADSLVLLDKAARLRPGNPRPPRNMAAIILERQDHPRYREDAMVYLARATALTPDDIPGHVLYARIASDLGQHGLAVDRYTLALSRSPNDATLLWRRGVANLKLGEAEASMADLTRAVEADPKFAEAYASRGLVLMLLQKHDDAIGDYRRAVALTPDNPAFLVGLALALANHGSAKDQEEAAALFSRTTQLHPEDPAAWAGWGSVLLDQGALGDALVKLETALRLQPQSAEFQRRVAWARAIDPQSPPGEVARALQLAQSANAATGSALPLMLDTLAAAYARSGQFDQAIESARHALVSAKQFEQAELIKPISERLAMYEAHQPYLLKP